MVLSRNPFGGHDRSDNTRESRDLLEEFVDQDVYNMSFLQQCRAREDRGELLAPEAERELAELIEKHDQDLRELARKIIADREVSVRMLTAKARVLLRFIDRGPDDICHEASRALAESVLKFPRTGS